MSYKNLMAEVLSAHADQILKAEKKSQDYVDLFPSQEDLPPLLTLADQVHAALQPVAPPKTFKEQLQRDLLAVAHLKQLERKQAARQESFPLSPTWILALTTFSIFLVGLFFLRTRQNRPDSEQP